MNSKAAVCTFSLLVALSIQAGQNNPPSIIVQQNAVIASQITASGKALVFGMVRHPRRYVTEIAHVLRILKDDSGSGTVTWVEKETIPPVALFGVIDLQTGGIAFAAPQGSLFHVVAFPGKGLHRGAAGNFERFEAGHEFLDVIWVRPEVGAWTYRGVDGSHDSDHVRNGRLSIDPGDMKPVGDSPPPPKQYLPGDTLVWIDPHTMEYASSEVPR